MDDSHAFACYNEILMFTFQSITRILTFLPCTKTLNPVEYTRKWGSAYREFEKQSCHFTLAAWCQMLSQHVKPQQVWKWWLPPTELDNVDTTFYWGNTYYRIHNFNIFAHSDISLLAKTDSGYIGQGFFKLTEMWLKSTNHGWHH